LATKTKTKKTEITTDLIEETEPAETTEVAVIPKKGSAKTTKATKVLSMDEMEKEMSAFLLKSTGVKIQSIKDVDVVKKYINTGNYSLNFAITGDLTKGLPAGRIYSFEGESGKGKSLQTCAISLQNAMTDIAIIIDIENALTGDFLTKIANNNSELANKVKIVNDIYTIEDLQNFLNKLIQFQLSKPEKNRPQISISIDSWSILTSKHEIEVVEKDEGKKDMSKAVAARQLLRALGGKFKEANITPMLVMHLTQNIGVMFGEKTVPASHGNAALFMSTTRFKLYATEEIVDKNKNPIGTILNFKTVKNRFTYKNKTAKIAFYFSGPKIGIDRFSGLPETLTTWGIFEASAKKVTESTTFTYVRDGEEFEFKLKNFEAFIEEMGGEESFINELNEKLKKAISGVEVDDNPENFEADDEDVADGLDAIIKGENK